MFWYLKTVHYNVMLLNQKWWYQMEIKTFVFSKKNTKKTDLCLTWPIYNVHYLHKWRILFPFLVRLWSGLQVFNTTFKLPYMYIGMIVFINGGNWIIHRKSMTFHKPIHWQNIFNIKFYQVHLLTDRTWMLKIFNVIQTERHLLLLLL